MTAEDAFKIIRCLIKTARGEDAPKSIIVDKSTGMKGIVPNEYCDVTASGYKLVFTCRGGMIVDCQQATTPSGKEFLKSRDGGSPFSQLKLEDQKYLTTLLLTKEEKGLEIEVVPAWIVVMGGARPYASHLFYSEKDAQDAMEEQLKYYKLYSGGKNQAKEMEKEAKAMVKEANAVPFFKKRKSA